MNREDIKVGDELETTMFGRTMKFTVRGLSPQGINTSFGPVPWSSLSMLRKVEKHTLPLEVTNEPT